MLIIDVFLINLFYANHVSFFIVIQWKLILIRLWFCDLYHLQIIGLKPMISFFAQLSESELL